MGRTTQPDTTSGTTVRPRQSKIRAATVRDATLTRAIASQRVQRSPAEPCVRSHRSIQAHVRVPAHPRAVPRAIQRNFALAAALLLPRRARTVPCDAAVRKAQKLTHVANLVETGFEEELTEFNQRALRQRTASIQIAFARFICRHQQTFVLRRSASETARDRPERRADSVGVN